MNQLLRRTDGKIRWGMIVATVAGLALFAIVKSLWGFGVETYRMVADRPRLEQRVTGCEQNDVNMRLEIRGLKTALDENKQLSLELLRELRRTR